MLGEGFECGVDLVCTKGGVELWGKEVSVRGIAGDTSALEDYTHHRGKNPVPLGQADLEGGCGILKGLHKGRQKSTHCLAKLNGFIPEVVKFGSFLPVHRDEHHQLLFQV